MPVSVSSGSARPPGQGDPSELSTRELLDLLQDDRLWLLRQLDDGHWPQWRLDLAALERELGQLLDRVAEQVEAP